MRIDRVERRAAPNKEAPNKEKNASPLIVAKKPIQGILMTYAPAIRINTFAVLLGLALFLIGGGARAQVETPEAAPPAASPPAAAAPESAAPAAAKQPPQHLGVVTCAGSTCHGASAPSQGSKVMQNEYILWQKQDKHSKAYKVLANEQSKRIARNLGLGDPAKEKLCLDCHTDNMPQNMRGNRFQLSDGVGCEACHGGSRDYLGPHASGLNTRQQNLDAGLYPTENPEARAKLCLACHLGTDEKFATHRIMGAGHPRLSFELDTYTAIEPAHYKIDEDYKKRKTAYPDVQVWAVGQLLAADRFLALLTNPKYQGTGFWPELSFYDCHACHHPMSLQRWSKTPMTEALGPGAVRLNDSAFLILDAIAARLAPAKASDYRQGIVALHKASAEGRASMQKAASALREMTQSLRAGVIGHEFSREDMNAIMRSLLRAAQAGDYDNYVGAEQFVMAIDAIGTTLEPKKPNSFTSAMTELYAATKSQDKFKPEQFQSALKSLAGKVAP
jgi:hypothetical protein